MTDETRTAIFADDKLVNTVLPEIADVGLKEAPFFRIVCGTGPRGVVWIVPIEATPAEVLQ
ncbi:MAG: hypothetical protein IT381_30170 [Deltaproteobacteria bacterium]|nr:hypothetical protein [Deltaproteobacteria bacterium]